MDDIEMSCEQKTVVKRTGIQRILYTWLHSYNGFKWLIKSEAAFQQELMLLLPLSIVAFLLPITALETVFLLLAMLFVLFAEMVNTAIEVIVDRIGVEYHQLSGIAKNIGSALVLLSMMMCLMIWGVILWPLL